MSTVTTRLRRGLVVLLVGVALLATPAPASAHASLVGSTPAAGARLDVLPGQVRLEFSEEVLEPAYVVLTGPDGASAAAGQPVVEGSVVTQTTAGGPDGGYTLAYRAVSKDGHPVPGQLTFTVGDSAAVAPSTAPAVEESGGEEAAGGEDPEAAVAAAPDGDGLLDRTVIAWLVGLGLFAGAGGLLLAARRAP